MATPTESNEPGGSRDQSFKEKTESLKRGFEKLLDSVVPERDRSNIGIMIPRIPASIKCQHDDLYKPQMVAIGPYQNHQEVKYEDIELQKLRSLKDFLDRKNNVGYQTYIKTMVALNELRPFSKCYSDSSVTNDTNIVQMLIIDGCFILELVLKLEEKKNHHLCLAGWDFMTVLSDLLLIENQIPFFVLKELYATFKGADINQLQLESDLKSLLVRNLFPYLGDTSFLQFCHGKDRWNPPVCHLLHLYHEFTLQNAKARNHNGMAICNGDKRKDSKLPVVIPSATQLLEYGFELSNSLLNSDVTIARRSTIKIPQLIVDASRKAILMNLLEFEQGLDDKSKSRWTGLMVLMNCLVKNKADLEILRTRCIVINLLPSEDNAIDFFGQLCKYIAIDFGDHYYSELVEQINRKCESYFRKKRATLMHEYFKNRWALMSFACSIIAITLTTVQTLVSVFTYRRRFI